MLTPIWAWLTRQNKHTKEVLSSGWTPVVLAMLISSIGGVILDMTVALFKGIAVFQPVINGVGGNLVAVQASRISTSLHRDAKLGVLPAYASKICTNPISVFCAKGKKKRDESAIFVLVSECLFVALN
jgi:solute carrier family 41